MVNTWLIVLNHNLKKDDCDNLYGHSQYETKLYIKGFGVKSYDQPEETDKQCRQGHGS